MRSLTTRPRPAGLAGPLLAGLLAIGVPQAQAQVSMGGPGAGAGQASPFKKKSAAPKPGERSLINRGYSSFTIAAVVDNEVILLEDIIAQIRPRLEASKRQLPPPQYKEFERREIENATKARIQQTIILKELKKRFPDGVLPERLVAALEGDFEKYLNRIAHQNNMKSTDELIAQLNKEGADLAALKKGFMDQVMATQYVNSVIQPKLRESTRQEMEEFYAQNPELFSEKAGAVWRQIEIKKGSDPAAAREKIESIRAELDAGADFAEVAKKQSQGPTAAAGGIWSRISKGSYADKAVDEAIFATPINEISAVIDGTKSFHIIRVEERSDGTPAPFVEVQEQIRDRLRGKQIQKLRQELLDSISDTHHVVTAFDDRQGGESLTSDEPAGQRR